MAYNTMWTGQVAAVLCSQWGDTGKGKIVHGMAEHADVIARGTGGPNAGHTIILDGKEYVFHVIPTGIVYDNDSKINLLGNGMVLNLESLCSELDSLEEAGYSYNNLMISEDAHVIFPFHIDLDKKKNTSQNGGGIGSTGCGIGPTYADKISRKGIMVRDLFKLDTLERKVRDRLEHYNNVRLGELTRKFCDSNLACEAYYDFISDDLINLDDETEQIINMLKPYAERIKPMVRNTREEIYNFLGEGRRVLLEGAQGLLLSVEHGSYPFVTSSDPSLNGACAGVGIPSSIVDDVWNLIKFPFMTRVGAGPFPSELAGQVQEDWCADSSKNVKFELDLFGVPFNKEGVYDFQDSKILELMNCDDSFRVGVGIRLAAGEYGATTQRPRRVGWSDAVLARYALQINGLGKVVFTKPDCLAGINSFKVCYAYEFNGGYTDVINRDSDWLRKVKPHYQIYDGYENISDCQVYSDLPSSLRDALETFNDFVGSQGFVVSNGPRKENIIIK